MVENTPEILLLNPPFGTIANPFISIPVLAGYLKHHDITVAGYDIKREFYVRLLTPQNILRGLKHSQERFLELNGKSELKFSEIFEYSMTFANLLTRSQYKNEVQQLLFPFADFSDIQNSRAMNSFIKIATFPYFPEMIFPEFSFYVGTSHNPCSSADILKASCDDTYYTRVFEEIITEHIVPAYNPRIVGFSVVFSTQIIPAFQCVRILKKYLPHVHITMGGPCISTFFREIKEKRLFTTVDSFVLDEGEIPLKMLSQELSKDIPELKNVPGLIYLSDDDIHFNAPAPSLNMEQTPPPDYTVFQLDQYLFTKDRLTVPFRLSKGCSWRKCTFCRTDSQMCRDFQQPSGEFIYQQLIHVIKTCGLSSFFFSDESADPEILEYISKRLLDDNIKIHWFAHTRVSSLLTHERCKLYRQSGCTEIALGIESFSNRILKLMKKGISVQLIEQVLKEMDGILPVMAYMIIGFPTETEEEVLAGYRKLTTFISQGLIQKRFYNLLEVIYGSDIWKNPEEYGITHLQIPEGADLFPNILDFDCPGMARTKAYQLGIRFNLHFEDADKIHEIREIPINNTKVPLRYNLKHIGEMITQHSFSPLPFSPWLDELDQTGEKLYPSSI